MGTPRTCEVEMTLGESSANSAVGALESVEAVDAAALKLAAAVTNAIPVGTPRDALAGTWLGHALHPALTDTVIGTWMSATLLDLTGGDRAAARRLVGMGVLGSLPTAVTGSADWSDSEAVDERVRRVGAVHAAANTAALGLQVASF